MPVSQAGQECVLHCGAPPGWLVRRPLAANFHWTVGRQVEIAGADAQNRAAEKLKLYVTLSKRRLLGDSRVTLPDAPVIDDNAGTDRSHRVSTLLCI